MTFLYRHQNCGLCGTRLDALDLTSKSLTQGNPMCLEQKGNKVDHKTIPII